MSCGETTPPVQQHIVAIDGLDLVVWYTKWLPAVGFGNIMATIKQRNVVGPFRSQLVYQTAPVRPDKPNDSVTFDVALNGAGESCSGLESMATVTAGVAWIRFGVSADLSTGTAPAQADVEMQITMDTCGMVLPSVTLSLATNTSVEQYAIISGWLPSLHAAIIKAAIVCRSLTGNFQWRLAVRTATTSKDDPSAWSTAFDSIAGYRTAGEFNTGELSPTNTTTIPVHLDLRFGAGYPHRDARSSQMMQPSEDAAASLPRDAATAVARQGARAAAWRAWDVQVERSRGHASFGGVPGWELFGGKAAGVRSSLTAGTGYRGARHLTDGISPVTRASPRTWTGSVRIPHRTKRRRTLMAGPPCGAHMMMIRLRMPTIIVWIRLGRVDLDMHPQR